MKIWGEKSAWIDEELKDKETENLQDIDNAGEAGKEDELLSDAEIKRIADMNLDDIIEDATSRQCFRRGFIR